MTFRSLIEEKAKFLHKVKKTGEHKDKTIAQLEKEKDAQTDPGERAERQFAINAKRGVYKKKDESMSYQRRCRPVLAESTVKEMVDSLLGEEKECEEGCECKKCKMKALRDKKGSKKKGNSDY